MRFRQRRAASAVAAGGLAAILLAGLACSGGGRREEKTSSLDGQKFVGRTSENRLMTPVNQLVTPHGRLVDLPGMRPQALALSPDGRLLAVAGKTNEVVILDPATGEIRQRVPLPADTAQVELPHPASPNILAADENGQVSYTGLAFSPDGRRLYLSNVNGSVKMFGIDGAGSVTGLYSIVLPPAGAPRREEEIPAGLAVSADGRRLYICGNLSNRLLEFDPEKGLYLGSFEVGVAPYDVVLSGGKAYVSNWGGRRPRPGETTGPAGRGTEVLVDPVTHVAAEGSVSVVDLAGGAAVVEIPVQRHASGLAVSPDGRYVVCANAASDNLSVIDVRTDSVVETIWTKPSPADLFGASPNALAFGPRGKRLYVANGTQNAVAVIAFNPAKRGSKLLGLIPVGWFPGAVLYHAGLEQLCVANIKGLGALKAPDEESGGLGFNSHQYHGSVSFVPLPGRHELGRLTSRVFDNYHRERIDLALRPPRPGIAPRPVPERIGESSVFKHVVYVIKENRTYDQVLGALERGNGDPSLCIFGERATPNQHKMVREFVLLDNTYCSGLLSADGHQWSTTAFATDYMEKSFAGFPRSYPDGMGPDEVDALAYAPSGFLWDNALRHGKTLWNFGEFAMPACGWKDPLLEGEPTWTDYWREYLKGDGKVIIGSEPGIPTIRPFTPTNHVGWKMEVPDAWRARAIIAQFDAWEKEGGFPELVLICLPDDHTSGTSAGSPTPSACVADNDLAFGRIVEALGRGPFWKDTVLFAIEDDPQNGWDHVSGYRTTAYCVSPYTRRGAVVSTLYNTTSILRTIEQILGLPPMNQFDASAEPLFDVFTETPDFTPFVATPNRVPLDEMNPEPAAIRDPGLREDALVSARLDFKRVDACPEDVFNRILWRAIKGTAVPFPEWAVTAADDDDD